MKGFRKMGGSKKGFSFSPKAGFSGSTGKVQHVRGYTRAVPKLGKSAKGGSRPAKFAGGGLAGAGDKLAGTLGAGGGGIAGALGRVMSQMGRVAPRPGVAAGSGPIKMPPAAMPPPPSPGAPPLVAPPRMPGRVGRGPGVGSFRRTPFIRR